MKKVWLSALLAALLLQPAALAETELTGTIAAGRTFAVTAAYGGIVSGVAAQVGDALAAGDALLTVAGEKVYAAQDGVVTGVFAAEGDDASAAAERYGAAIVIAPERKFTVYMTAEDEFRAEDSNRIELGETLYLRCKEDGTHRGVGVVTAVNGLTYTIECTGGEFSNGEVVYAARQQSVNKAERVGIGTVVAAEAEPISASGVVVRCHVSAGDAVEAGQLLLETAAGDLSGANWNGGALAAAEAGIVTEMAVQTGENVSAGQVIAVMADPDDLCVQVSVPETDIALAREGAQAMLTLESGAEIAGTVEFLSYLADDDGAYPAVIRVDAMPADARIGQSVRVTLTEDE